MSKTKQTIEQGDNAQLQLVQEVRSSEQEELPASQVETEPTEVPSLTETPSEDSKDSHLSPGERRKPRSKPGRIRIPLSGLVSLTALELRILDCASFQRLRRVRQLGGTFIVYPGATHTRFEHSIGAVHVAQEMIDALDRNARTTDTREPLPVGDKKRIRLAALLHDVGHLAYGHTLEDEVRIVEKHDHPARLNFLLGEGRDIHDVFKRSGELEVLEDVKVILAKDAPEKLPADKVYWADIVANTICADLLDYLRRDFYHLGFTCDFDDHILEYLTLAKDEAGRNRLAIMLERSGKRRSDAVTMILDILGLRYTLAESALFHHAKDCHSAMLTRAVLESKYLLELLHNRAPERGLKAKYESSPGNQVSSYFERETVKRGTAQDEDTGYRIEEPELLALGDDQLVELLANDKDPVASLLGSMLHERQLYRLITTIDYTKAGRVRMREEIIERTHRFPQKKHVLETQIEKDLELPRGSVLFYTPSAKMNAKIAEVHIVAGGLAIPLARFEERNQDELTGGFLRAQLHRFERLWRSYVFVHPTLSDIQIEDVKEYVDATFGLQADGDSEEQIAEARENGYYRIAERRFKKLYPSLQIAELEDARSKARQVYHRGKRRDRPVRRHLEALAGALGK